jgi:tyrosine-protein phosphatase SIW14
MGMFCRLNGILSAFLFGAALSGLAPAADANEPPIPNFYQVETAVYRGGHPGPEGLAALKDLGVRSIVNLDNDAASNQEEEAAAAQLGLNYIPIPMSGFWAPTDGQIDRAIQVLSDPSARPLFVHCHHGQDRTGLVVGLYRVLVENTSPAMAYQEMLHFGFHTDLVFLNHYFEQRTGYED